MNAIALSLFALAAPQDAPALLPQMPAQWRFERIDFPLSFAPELELEGFEELSFAPGMFEPGASEYFTYVLGVRLEGGPAVDEGFLESFLEGYYRGLCKAVGESRDLALDVSKVTAAVHRVGARFEATVGMYDPFVTGAPLELHIDWSVRAGARSTELFGLASPAAKDAPIWDELRALRADWEAQRPMIAALNHVYFVPSPETYAALRDCEFLRETLAVSEERTTRRADMSYSGLYFYGRNTYFEFLDPTGAQLGPGASGVALGLETVGGTDVLAEELDARGIARFDGAITRELDGAPLPWFRIMGIESAHASSRLSVFTMEYDPRFLARWHPELPPDAPSLLGGQVLARYRAHLDPGGAARLFDDIATVHLTLDEAERERFLATLRSAGYSVEESASTWIGAGPDVRFVVRAANRANAAPDVARGGVTGIELSLSRALDREPLRVGGVGLTFEDRTARLEFGP